MQGCLSLPHSGVKGAFLTTFLYHSLIHHRKTVTDLQDQVEEELPSL